MPSLTAHHLFGLSVLENGVHLGGSDEKDAFLWGCQGPDPFFFGAFGIRPRTYLRFGQMLHHVDVTESLAFFQQYLKTSSGEDHGILRGYLYGYLCHYALDRTSHPYIYSRQYRESNPPGAQKDSKYYHMRLESAIDVAFSGRTSNPTDLLPSNRTVRKRVGKMLSSASRHLYGVTLPFGCFRRASGRMLLLERFLKSETGKKRRFFSGIERLFFSGSLYDAMSHEAGTKGITDPLNLSRAPWIDPMDGAVRSEDFHELFQCAVRFAAYLIDLFETAPFNESVTGSIDFNGVLESHRSEL